MIGNSLSDEQRALIQNWIDTNLTHYESLDGVEYFITEDSEGNPFPQDIQFCEIGGCTNPESSNFNPLAQVEDGTCIFDGYLHFPWARYPDGGVDADGKIGDFGADMDILDMIRALHSPSGCGFAEDCPTDGQGNSLGYQYNDFASLDLDLDGVVSFEDGLAFSSDDELTISNPNENCIPNNLSTNPDASDQPYCLGDARPYEFIKRVYELIDGGAPAYQFITTYFPTGGANISMQDIEYFEDYDINNDGNVDIVDTIAWRNLGRHDIIILILKMINLEIDLPEFAPDDTLQQFADELMVTMSYAKDFYSENQVVGTTPDGENIVAPVYEGYEQITRESTKIIPYFGAKNASIKGSSIFTASMSDTNKLYYFGVTDGDPHSSKSETQFYVAYGHFAGSGSDTHNGNRKGPSEAVYKQYISTLSDYNKTEYGFLISSGSEVMTLQSGKDGEVIVHKNDHDDFIYVLNFKQSKFKDRLQAGTWTLNLSGSIGNKGVTIKLTDDSKQRRLPPVTTEAGRQFNIFSGSEGSLAEGRSIGDRYGFFYPDVGIMVLGEKISRKIRSGSSGAGHTSPTPSFNSSINGNNQLFPNTSSTAHSDNALLLVNAMKKYNGNALTLFGEKDLVDKYYACRISPGEFNFTNNLTILSGSGNSMISPEPGRINEFPISKSYTGLDGVNYTSGSLTMGGNPNTYITLVSLFNKYGNCVAIAKLNKPLRKDTSREVVIKVKLSY